MTDLKIDDLPPTQELILEVLMARHRLGDTYWTFSNRVLPAARSLETGGVITIRTGGQPHRFEARFTPAAEKQLMDNPDSTYLPPVGPILTDAQARDLLAVANTVLSDRSYFGTTFDGREWANATRAVARIESAHRLNGAH